MSDTRYSKTHPLFEMASPFPDEPGTVMLLEPPFSDEDILAECLVEGRYGKPFVLESNGVRALYFGSLRFQQSAMRLAEPYVLEIGYTRAMMAFMLFNARPRYLALLGLGGGSLAKFCHRSLPAAAITVIEYDENVIALRKAFDVPDDDARFRIECADAVAYVAETPERFDVVLVDLFDGDGISATLADATFYRDLHCGLAGNGIMVMNIAGDRPQAARHIALVREAFDDRVIAFSLRDDGNDLLFAFRNPAFEPNWKWMKSIARELQQRLGLDFPRFAQLLERGYDTRLAQRLSD